VGGRSAAALNVIPLAADDEAQVPGDGVVEGGGGVATETGCVRGGQQREWREGADGQRAGRE
jgi:hypothetical protein